MKTIKNVFATLVVVCFSVLYVCQVQAQSIISNSDLLQGFDEQAVLNDLRERNVPLSEYAGILRTAQSIYMQKKVGTYSTTPIIYKTTDSAGGCVNTDFEDNSLVGWTGFTGMAPAGGTYGYPGGCCPNAGLISTRHTIMSGSGNDPCGGFPVVAPGGSFSLRLGNNQVNAEAEVIEQTFLVDEENSGFYYQYAAVLEDASHVAEEQPFFEVVMFNQNGDTIPCSYYRISAGQGISGFVNSTSCSQAIYKPWTKVTFDLNNYIGQQVTIKFTTADCAQGGHFGYAYIDCSCFKSEITDPYYCDGYNPDTTLTLIAPTGFESYEWVSPTGAVVGTTQTATLQNPKIGDVYTVFLTPYHTGQNDSCNLTLFKEIKLNPHPILPDYLLKQNVFTPNADNINEVFRTGHLSWISKFYVKIYNRWGQLMFESDNPLIEWNGKDKNGDRVEDGIYYWHAGYVSSCKPNDPMILSKGFLHLLR